MEIILVGAETGTKTVNTNYLISRACIDDQADTNPRHFIQFIMVDNIQMEAFFDNTMLRDTAFDAITTAMSDGSKTITINTL